MNRPSKTSSSSNLANTDKSSSVVYLTVSQDESGQRIDNFLLTKLKGVPRPRIYKILRKGEIRVNKGRVKPTYRIQMNDVVRIPPNLNILSANNDNKARINKALLKTLEQRILYEDEGLLIINKPSGLAVHGGSGLGYGLIEVARALRPDCRSLELVHRLDRETSGCIILSKKRSILRELHSLLRGEQGKSIDKKYLALVDGKWHGKQHIINAALKKNVLRSGERIVRVSSEGKPSETRVKIIRQFQSATLIEAVPVTGRTHQIRVHCQYAGHPILGDQRYGNEASNMCSKQYRVKRLFLHAKSLKFKLALSNQEIDVYAPLDEDLEQVLDKLSE